MSFAFSRPFFRLPARNLSFFSGLHNFEYIGSSAVSPTTIAAHTLEYIHLMGGLSWPTTIVVFTVGMRTLLFPSYVKQMQASITSMNLKEDISRYQSQIQALKSQQKLSEARDELMKMYKFMRDNNCSPGRSILLSLIPIPFFMSTFFALRNMTNQHLLSFIDGGWFWFSDLTLADPFYVLPVLSSLSMLASFELSHRFNPMAIPPKMATFIRILGILSVPLLSFMPSVL